MALREELLSLKPMLGTDAPEFYDKVKSIAARYTSAGGKRHQATNAGSGRHHFAFIPRQTVFQQKPFMAVSADERKHRKRQTRPFYFR